MKEAKLVLNKNPCKISNSVIKLFLIIKTTYQLKEICYKTIINKS